MLKSLPIQLGIAILLALLLGKFLDLETIRLFFTLSCGLKEILMGVLPFIIFSYIAAAILSMEQRAPFLILSILIMVTFSNAFTVLLSYGVSIAFLPLITYTNSAGLGMVVEAVKPFFTLNVPLLLQPDQSMLLGICVGLIFSFIKVPSVTAFTQNIRHYVTLFLQKAFIPLLPLYIFGFVLKMEYEGTLSLLFKNCGQIFALLCVLILAYLALLYLAASGFRPRRFMDLIRIMFPAGLTGFSTMSSAATMPITLAATEKNTRNEQFAQLIIPATVNIHLMGDALAIPVLTLAILTLSGLPLPTFENFLLFTVYFCLAKFSVAGIPGGGIIVMLPILQKYLGLTPEMASLITTIYIIQDPFLTFANVMGNGAFALLVQKITGQAEKRGKL